MDWKRICVAALSVAIGIGGGTYIIEGSIRDAYSSWIGYIAGYAIREYQHSKEKGNE